MSKISELNNDVLFHVFKFLDFKELLTITVVCKKWHHIVNKNKDIWRLFVPKHDWGTLHKIDTFKNMLIKYSTRVKKEFWFPYPNKTFEKRIQFTKFLMHINYMIYGSEAYKKSGISLYSRLNPIYNFIDGNEEMAAEVLIPENDILDEDENERNNEDINTEKYNTELLNVLYFIQRKFDYGDEAEDYYAPSGKRMWKKSELVKCEKFIADIQHVLEPKYVNSKRVNINDVMKNVEGLDDAAILQKETREVDAILEKMKADQSVKEAERMRDTIMDDEQLWEDHSKKWEGKVEQYYKRPSLSFYRELTKVMYGPNHEWKVRTFFLNEGCFNENYELAYQLYVGQEAVLHRALFFEL